MDNDTITASSIDLDTAFRNLLNASTGAGTAAQFVRLEKNGDKVKLAFTERGAQLDEKYQRAYQIAEEKGPMDREVVEVMGELSAEWKSYPGVVENDINELIESGKATEARDRAREAALEWAGVLKEGGIKSPNDLESGERPSILFAQILGNYEFALERTEDLSEALEVAELSRAVEPSDPENILSAIVSLSIRTGDFDRVITELAPLEDSLAPYVLYGRALAYFALNQEENAKSAIQNALRAWPHVAQGIGREWPTGAAIPKPGEAVSETQVLYGYHEVFGPAWASVEGAIEWLRTEEKLFQRSGGKVQPHLGLTRSGMKTDGHGNVIPQNEQDKQKAVLRAAQALGEDTFARFVHIEGNQFGYDVTARGVEMEELLLGLQRRDMKQQARAEAIRELIKEWPGHANAAIAVARLLGREKKYEEAVDLLETAVFDLQKFWPDDFVGKGIIDVDIHNNKPLLTAYAFIVVFLTEMGDREAARNFASDALAINPKDQLGIRQKAIELAMMDGDTEEALKLIDQAQDPISAYNLFGRALALYSLGKKDEATLALNNAVESRPKVYRELTSDRHRMPHNYNPSYVKYHSQEEAYNYNQLWSSLWRNTLGALAWLRKEGKAASRIVA